MIKQDKSKTNFKNKKNRTNLYDRSFMKWNLESRLATLQEQAIKLSLHSGSFLHDIQNSEKYKEFSEAIGSLETMVELAKYSIEPLAETSANSKYIKLQNLKDHTDKIALERIKENLKEEKSKEDLKNPDLIDVDFDEVKPVKKSLFRKLFLFWLD